MKMRPSVKLNDKVKIASSTEHGVVIGVATYTFAEPSMLVRYIAADGRAVESWWTQSALVHFDPNA